MTFQLNQIEFNLIAQNYQDLTPTQIHECQYRDRAYRECCSKHCEIAFECIRDETNLESISRNYRWADNTYQLTEKGNGEPRDVSLFIS